MKDVFDLEIVTRYLKRYPDSSVIIISNKKLAAQDYWKSIQQHLGIKKKAFIVTNNEYSMDGVPFNDSLILMAGRWWENKNSRDFMLHVSLTKLTIPITYIPPFLKGGEGNEE